MKIAFIGGSGHYGLALPAIQAREDLRVVGLAKGCAQEDVTGAARNLPGVPVDEDYRAMLDREQPDLAVVNPWYCLSAEVAAECGFAEANNFIRRFAAHFGETPAQYRRNQAEQTKRERP